MQMQPGMLAAVCLAAALHLGSTFEAAADPKYPGAVVVKLGEIRWGQYKAINGIRGIEFPSKADFPLSEVIREWPLAGASTVVIRVQKPGDRVFGWDGRTLPAEVAQRLRSEIDAVNAFDMLPLLILFDPSPQCQFDSEAAYFEAARTLLRELGPDRWFLLCLSDRLDDPRWKAQDSTVDPVASVRSFAAGLKRDHPQLVIGAGSGSAAENERLFAGDAPFNVLIGRVDSLGFGEGAVRSDQIPVIETIAAENLTDDQLAEAVRKIGFNRVQESFPYGMAVVLDQESESPMAPVRGFLDKLRGEVDEVQKEITNAVPPSEDMNAVLDPKEAEEGFVSLFNGRDLSGWVPICRPGNFTVRDGCVVIETFKGGWLRSWDLYEDFVFRGEYWIEEGGNSGFFIRAPLDGRASRIGFEFQIMGQPADTPLSIDVTGCIYDVKAPDGNFMKPGEWNEVEIRCVGPEVTIIWNGQTAHHFRHEEVPGMEHRALAGYIGLQDHYDEVKFRNLRIKRLN